MAPLVAATDLTTELEAALRRGEMRVHYLPTVGLEDGLVIGVEALARWQRDDRLLATQEFLDLAERTGHIVQIGEWVMQRACQDVARWNAQNADRTPLRLAVNVSLRQLTEPAAVAIVRSVLQETGFDPALLTLELSEDALHALGHAAGPTMHAFKELGVRLSVDDFGTGASSLVALQRYQLDEIKIDRSFVAQMDEDAAAAAIVRGVTRLAQSLRLHTVAEGVERPGQEQMLRALLCDAAQGWLFAKPMEDLDGAVTAATAAAVSSLQRKPVEHTELIDGSGAMVGLVALARDVGEQRRAAVALGQTHEALGLHAAELAAANVRLATFAGTLAHDMAQPLAAADGFLRLLASHAAGDLVEEHRGWLAGAIRGTDRLGQAVDALYRNATAAELQLAAVDLSVVVAELVPSLLSEIGDAELVVEDLPVVHADRGFVTQVLANLVQNAGRYRDDERPLVITVAAACDGPSWVVAVADSGKGISTDELEGVFEAGARGRSSEGTDGTGTGLATVRTLMHRMGGDVWAEPVPGGGVRMCLRFVPVG